MPEGMNNEELSLWLRDTWRLESERVDGDDPEVDRLVNSDLVSLRFAVLTQLLGKLADPSRDVLCLQRGDAEGSEAAGRWDARSLCSGVVVPWNQDNQSVLGGSADPYVNNPLRRPRLDEQTTALSRPAEWDALLAFLKEASHTSDTPVIERAVRRCLRSVARRLHRQAVHFGVPPRVSLDQVIELLENYLAAPSNGLRPLAAASALLKVVGSALGLFSVSSQGLNEPDRATGAPGDIVCSDLDGKPVLVAEVKDQNLRIVDFEASLQKARKRDVRNLMFVVPRLSPSEAERIRERIAAVWAQGTNVYRTSVPELARPIFMLLEERWRHEFLAELGNELNRRSAPFSHRQEFADLLDVLDVPR